MRTSTIRDVTTKSQTYEQLAHFIKDEMRMSHVYQPVMLRELLKRKGAATVTEVARALLAEDRSQLEYYEQITKNMVGRVLTSNRRITQKERASWAKAVSAASPNLSSIKRS